VAAVDTAVVAKAVDAVAVAKVSTLATADRLRKATARSAWKSYVAEISRLFLGHSENVRVRASAAHRSCFSVSNAEAQF